MLASLVIVVDLAVELHHLLLPELVPFLEPDEDAVHEARPLPDKPLRCHLLALVGVRDHGLSVFVDGLVDFFSCERLESLRILLVSGV